LDGKRLIEEYKKLGLNLEYADNSVTAGITAMWQRLSTGRLKVFNTLTHFFSEYRIYRRDKNHKIVKVNDHLMDCIVGDTPVLTDVGWVPIKQLQGRSGVLYGPSGWQEFSSCALYKKNAETVKVVLSDGRIIQCTPDHQFLTTEHGWVRADNLAGLTCLDVVSQSICESLIQSSSPKSAKSSMESDSTDVVGTSGAVIGTPAYCFIARFGRSIMDLFQKAITSITSIMTVPRIACSTLSFTNGESIKVCTPVSLGQGSGLESTSTPSGISHRSGTDLRRVLNGTKSTLKSAWLWLTSVMPKRSVSSVVVRTPRPEVVLNQAGFVRTPASLPTDVTPGLILRPDSVPSAARISLSSQNIRSNDAVLKNAHRVSVLRVVKSAPSDVYCLTASRDSAFAVSGGIVIHNCGRYILMSGLELAIPAPLSAQNPTVESYFGGGYSVPASSWMGA
jgi:hypothetical protein